jgi:hypothetical protein
MYTYLTLLEATSRTFFVPVLELLGSGKVVAQLLLSDMGNTFRYGERESEVDLKKP